MLTYDESQLSYYGTPRHSGRYPLGDKVGFAIQDCIKPATRRTCSLIRTHIVQYIFYNYPDTYNTFQAKDYNKILNNAIDILEKNGYLTLSDLNDMIDLQLNSNKPSFFDMYSDWV